MKIVSNVFCVAVALSFLLPGCARRESLPPSVLYPDSPTLEAQVTERLALDPQLKNQDIRVHAFRGEVDLDGRVETAEQRVQAEKLTWSVPGVRAVQNNLLLRAPGRR